MIKKLAAAVAGAAVVLGGAASALASPGYGSLPTAAELEAFLIVPHYCSISAGSAELDLNQNYGLHSVNGGYLAKGNGHDAFRVSQNGDTIWSLSDVDVLLEPVGANTGGATRITLNFDGADANGSPDLLASLGSGDTHLETGLRYDNPVTMGAILQDTNGQFAAGEYRIGAELTCVSGVELPE